MGQIGVVSGRDGFSRSSIWSIQRKQKSAFFAAPPEPVAGPQDVGQFDVVTGTSAGGGGFYVAHTMWAILVEVPFSLVEHPYSPSLFLLSSFSAQTLWVSSVQTMKAKIGFLCWPSRTCRV
ncbi:hypothetical protein [Alteribacillus iranensis]|uniref:Uncharacterized protein n=1 Tax=Alteribacillus iranensis TaxID=930128 RepID=A0A1I2C2P2_9BACI|nr:hypothetical protein [Alteribacillus iranensis]SFE62599.1 hypothetical protein SAMN05192532_102659 [Alteribacillus iranensis]